MNKSCILVYMTFPTVEEGKRIGRILVEKRLAACVNILGPCTSIYRWKGGIEQEEEIAAIAKTTQDIYPAFEKTVLDEHPYDVPCITVFTIEQGNPDYLAWLVHETT